MPEFLIAPAERSGCQDLNTVKEAVENANQIQNSAIDSILDTEVVDEELYMAELSSGLSLEWLAVIEEVDKPLPLRKAASSL